MVRRKVSFNKQLKADKQSGMINLSCAKCSNAASPMYRPEAYPACSIAMNPIMILMVDERMKNMNYTNLF